MSENSIFYYPYAFFSDSQLPLLKATALYFDKIYLLDPLKANVQGSEVGTVTQGNGLVDGIRLLEKENILVRIRPEEVLHKYENEIANSIREDMQDKEFLAECKSSHVKQWTLALQKIPKEIRDDPRFKPMDDSMKNIMGQLPRNLSQQGYFEGYAEGYYDEQRYIEGKTYIEGYMNEQGNKEYRFGDYPIELGESIMLNHAIFGGLLYSQAIPVTDDPFHKRILDIKIRRAYNSPQIKQLIEDDQKIRKIKKNQLALTTLRDFELAIIPPELPMKKIIEYRNEHEKDLEETRHEFGILARTMRETPWSKEFAEKIDQDIIPHKIDPQLKKSEENRNSWIDRNKQKIQVAVAAATITLTIITGVPFPVIPLLAAGGTGLVGGLDLMKRNPQNGFHYLLKIKEKRR